MEDIAAFQQLQLVVDDMRKAAEAADWDLFLQLQSKYNQAAEILASCSNMDVMLHAQVAEILRHVQKSLNVILPLANAWREQVGNELAGAHKAAKLNRTYQS